MKKKLIIPLLVLFNSLNSIAQNPSIPMTFFTNQWIGTFGNIYSSSNIGIGLENPQYTLDILESGPSLPNSFKGIRIFDDQDINNYNFLKIDKSNNQNWGIDMKYNNIFSHIRLYNDILNIATSNLIGSSPTSAIADGLSISLSGNIGIGTINPSTRFQINQSNPNKPFNSFINGRSKHFQLWVRKDANGNNLPSYTPLPKYFASNKINFIQSFSICGDNDVKSFENGPTSGGYFIGSNNGLVSTALYSSDNPNKNCTGIYCIVEGNDPNFDMMYNATGVKGNLQNSENGTGIDFRVESNSKSYGAVLNAISNEESVGLIANGDIGAFGEPTTNSLSFGIKATSFGGLIGSYGVYTRSGGSATLNNGIYSISGIPSLTHFTPTGTGVYSWGGYFTSLGENSSGESGGLYCETQSNSANSFGIYAKCPISSPINGYAGYFDGDLFCISPPWSPSDEKLKENINELKNGLEIIESLNPKSFTYKKNLINDGYNLPLGNKFGLIAQEVERVLPDLTKKSNIFGTQDSLGKSLRKNIEILSVDYTSLIPILISAIKEQQNTINLLSKKIESIETKKSNQFISGEKNLDGIAELFQNNPNPFNDICEIKYKLSDEVKNASILIFNMNGNLIKEFSLNTKNKNGYIIINASEFGPGMYFYSLIEDSKEIDTKRMILTK